MHIKQIKTMKYEKHTHPTLANSNETTTQTKGQRDMCTCFTTKLLNGKILVSLV